LHYGSCACGESQQGLNPKSHSRSGHRTILPNRISRAHDNVQTKTLWCKKINLSSSPLRWYLLRTLRLNPCKQPGHSPLFFSVYNYTTCKWTLSAIIVQVQVHAIIVQVQVQTLFVNFVIANSIQVTIISIINALTCCFFYVTHWRLVS